MKITFDKAYLAELYYDGRCRDKKHRFQPQIIKRYIRVLDIMSSLDTVEALFRYNGLNYEVLTGDKKRIESVRVNDQYRIEFKSSVVAGEEIFTICNILDLTNHYK